MTVSGDPLGETSVMSESVLLSNLQNPDRPFGWRESNKFTDSHMVRDYQVRYSSETNTHKQAMHNTAKMGPFYEKYMKKMG